MFCCSNCIKTIMDHVICISNGNSTKKQNHYSWFSTRTIFFSVGDTCTTENIACADFAHSICLEGFCTCQSGYYPHAQSKICLAEHGEIADSAENCDVTSTLVEWNDQTKICGCKPNNFNIGGLRTCIKQTQGFGVPSCTQNVQCTLHGLAHCDASQIIKICNCHEYAKYDETSQMCVPIEGLNKYCNDKSDCQLTNTVCSERNTCVCAENYIAVDEQCKPGNGAPCEKTDDCGYDNATCVSDSKDEKHCQCKSGLVFVKNRCMEEIEFEEECEENEQCVPLLGTLSKCEENKCICEGDTHYRDGRCNKKTRESTNDFNILFIELNCTFLIYFTAIGEICKTTSECFAETDPDIVECRNAVCNCQIGYRKDVEKQVCVRPASKSKLYCFS